VPDTVGYSLPSEYADMVRKLVKDIPGAIISVHCHNDLGLAVANTLSGIRAGATQVECTVNGIGERAGNACLEEVAMALALNQDQYGREAKIDTTKLYDLSHLVADLTGCRLAVNKPISGRTIFATEAGIHQDGLLKNPDTYLPFRPEMVGASGIELVLGRHSGRRAVARRLQELGLAATDEQVLAVLDRIKKVPKGTIIDDALLRQLATP
jgi:2-isopropylmalate synthase